MGGTAGAGHNKPALAVTEVRIDRVGFIWALENRAGWATAHLVKWISHGDSFPSDRTVKRREVLYLSRHCCTSIYIYTILSIVQTKPVSENKNKLENKSENIDSLRGIQDRMRIFAQERDWEQFHDPKSLILALVGEVGELAELFQWLPADQASSLAQQPELQQRVGEELADILLYLARVADVVGLDLAEVTDAKFKSVEKRFPAEHVKGDAPIKK